MKLPNDMLYGRNRPPANTETEKTLWIKMFLGYIAQHELELRHGYSTPTKLSLGMICYHKGRTGTVEKLLEKEGLLEGPCWEFKPDMKAVRARMEAFIKEAPEFEYQVRTKEKTYDPPVAKKRIEHVYTKVDRLTPEQLCYIYLHQDEYILSVYTHTYKIRGGRRNHYSTMTRETEDLMVFPKALHKQAETELLNAQLEDIGQKFMLRVLSEMMGNTFKTLHISNKSYYRDMEELLEENEHPVEEFRAEDVPTEEDLTRRIIQATRNVRLMRRACRELLQLRQTLREQGGDAAYHKKFVEAIKEIIRNESPLLLTHEDKKVSSLAKAYLEGKIEI